MARKPRVFGESGVYHIILRGNNRQIIFCDDRDRLFFISRLKKYAEQLNLDIYAFCLMNNHVHILVGKANGALSLFVQKLANSYVYYFNRKYERSGHLFQGRFKSEPIVDDIYFKTVFRYILQNPQKAEIAKIDSYKWNSYKFLFNNEEKFINRDFIYSLFGEEKQLVTFLVQENKDVCMEYENKLLISDMKALKIIKRILGIKTPYELVQFDIDTQIQKIKLLKISGLSINQISRLTGISRKITKIA